MKIGIVRSLFNEEITHKMLNSAVETARRYKLSAVVVDVPGAFDAPLAVQKLLQKKDIAGVATIGAIITGETKHDEVIALSTAKTLQELSLKFSKPVTLGIAGHGMTEEQARSRAGEYGRRAIDALAQLLNQYSVSAKQPK